MNKKGILAALVVLAAAGGGYVISKKYDIGMDDISATIAYLEARTIGTSPEIITANSPANNLAEPTPAPTPAYTPANGSVKKKQNNSLGANDQPVSAGDASVTPIKGAINEKPNFYDEVTVNGTLYKIEINIVGDDPFVHNVTEMLHKIKEYTPGRYAEVIIHAPKTIKRSPDNFNWYGGAPEDDFIKLTKTTEEYGGSDDTSTIKEGIADFYPELVNAMRSKTGNVFKSAYESELAVASTNANYKVELGLWNEEQANRYVKRISEKLKSGTFYNGAVGGDVTAANKRVAEGK